MKVVKKMPSTDKKINSTWLFFISSFKKKAPHKEPKIGKRPRIMPAKELEVISMP